MSSLVEFHRDETYIYLYDDEKNEILVYTISGEPEIRELSQSEIDAAYEKEIETRLASTLKKGQNIEKVKANKCAYNMLTKKIRKECPKDVFAKQYEEKTLTERTVYHHMVGDVKVAPIPIDEIRAIALENPNIFLKGKQTETEDDIRSNILKAKYNLSCLFRDEPEITGISGFEHFDFGSVSDIRDFYNYTDCVGNGANMLEWYSFEKVEKFGGIELPIIYYRWRKYGMDVDLGKWLWDNNESFRKFCYNVFKFTRNHLLARFILVMVDAALSKREKEHLTKLLKDFE